MKKLFVALLLTGTVAFAAVMTGAPETVVREYDFNAVDKIHVENTSGKITVTKMVRPKIEIAAVKRKFPERCKLTMEKSDFSEIIVRVERPIGEDCEVDLDLKVPQDIDLNVWSGSGSVNVSGLEGKFEFNVGSGSVRADGKFKKVEGKSGSGSVDIDGVAGGGSISVGSGSVNLKFLENPAGKLDVKTGSGDAILAFPKYSKVNANLVTGSGDVVNELGSTESADYGVTVKTGSGDLKVKAY